MTLDIALAHAARGRRIFPATADKKPLIDDFPNLATCDEATIREWWKQWPRANVAMSTDGYCVIDSDCKKGKNGQAELLRLEMEGFELPPTMTQSTPSGGFHYIYETDTP